MGDKKRFTWINKDAANLTSKDHINQVNSHAQRVTWGLRNGKTVRLEKSRASIRKTQFPWHYVSDTRMCLHDGDNGEHSEHRSALRRIATGSKPMSPPVLSDPSSDSPLHEQLDPFMLLPGITTLRERNLLHYCNSDPFSQSFTI
jgi:hypothetical protein